MQHRYKVGQMLDLRPAPGSSNRPAGPCEVVFCLPHDKGPMLYRIKSLGESNERVVDEIDLSPSDLTKASFVGDESVFNIAVSKR